MFASPRKRNFVLCLLLAAATLALYDRVAYHPFVNCDDDRYVTENSNVRAGLSWATVRWAFTSTAEANWHPLTWLSHALDCQLFRLNPAGHHYVSVLLHILNAVLLFLLLWRATGFAGRAWMVAALFALHPINVESVAWVAERKNVLSMLLFLLALEAYRRYAQRPAVARYGVVALLFALGLMAKPQVVSFPFVLLLWDYWPLGRMFPLAQPEIPGPAGRTSVRTPSRLVLEKLPLMLLCAAASVVTLEAQRAGGTLRPFAEYPLSVRLQNAAVSYVRYLGKAFWPSTLAPMYPHPEDTLAAWQVGGALLFLLAVTVAVVVARRHRYLATGWFWFLGTLVPMIGLVQVASQAMADRYAYLPSIGLFVAVCWGVAECAEHWHVSPRWLAAPGLAALAALSAVTHRQLAYWGDNLTLWTHTVRVTSDNFLAEDNLGGALIAAGRVEDAMPHFRRAAQISPFDEMANLNLAVHAQARRDFGEAIARYEIVVRVARDQKRQSTAYSNLGFAYLDLGDHVHAKESYQTAVRLDPSNARPMFGLALLAHRTGDLARAADYYTRALSVQPSDLGYLLLAQALEKAGRAAEAQFAYRKAEQLSSDLNQARQAARSLLAQ